MEEGFENDSDHQHELDDMHDDMQEQLESQLKEWTEIAHSKLSATREARKRSEYDAQLLANRIALLKEEEFKAWKDIEATRKRTQDAFESRQQREAQMQHREAVKRLKEQKLEEQRHRITETRVRDQAAKAQIQSALQASKKTAAQETKAELRAQHVQLEKHSLTEAERRKEAASKLRLRNSLRSARPDSRSDSQQLQRSGSLQLEWKARSNSQERSQNISPNATGLEKEEDELLRRLRFAKATSRNGPPRPELHDTPRTQGTRAQPSVRDRVRCAELAAARSRFEVESPMTLAAFESGRSSVDSERGRHSGYG